MLHLVGEADARLQLPLAAIRNGVVDAASPAWDEETQLPPGSGLPERWSRLVDAASSSPGVIQRARTARARAAAERLAGMPARVAAGKLEIVFADETQLAELVESLEHATP